VEEFRVCIAVPKPQLKQVTKTCWTLPRFACEKIVSTTERFLRTRFHNDRPAKLNLSMAPSHTTLDTPEPQKYEHEPKVGSTAMSHHGMYQSDTDTDP